MAFMPLSEDLFKRFEYPQSEAHIRNITNIQVFENL